MTELERDFIDLIRDRFGPYAVPLAWAVVWIDRGLARVGRWWWTPR